MLDTDNPVGTCVRTFFPMFMWFYLFLRYFEVTVVKSVSILHVQTLN